jgi:hypothetical protein
MSVDLIVNALVTGAAAGASATAVTDAYAGVKLGVRRLFHRAAEDGAVEGDPDKAVDELLATVEAAPEENRDALAEQLARLGAEADIAGDADLIAAARRLVELAGGPARVGKYHVEVRDNTGVQVGDNATMTINLDPRERR